MRSHRSAEEYVKGLLERFSYKPGWEIEVWPYDAIYCDPLYAVRIMMQFKAPNAAHWDQEIQPITRLARTMFFLWAELDVLDESELVQRIADNVLLFENHEFEEWARFDGKRLYRPHPELETKA